MPNVVQRHDDIAVQCHVLYIIIYFVFIIKLKLTIDSTFGFPAVIVGAMACVVCTPWVKSVGCHYMYTQLDINGNDDIQTM